MKLAFRIALVGILGWVVQGVAQAPTKLAKAGAEQKQLGYFAGTWTLVADTKATALTAPGKIIETEKNVWMPGGFYLVSHVSNSAPAAEPFGSHNSGEAVWGYDPSEKVYTHDEFNSAGTSHHCKGTVQGDTWTFNCVVVEGDKTTKTRYTAKEISPTSYTFKVEIATDNGGWSTMMEGKATKAAAKPKPST